MKSARPVRPVGLFDIMILIAATGGGLAVFQLVQKYVLVRPLRWEFLFARPPQGWTPAGFLVRLIEWIGPTLPFAGAWTGAVPILQLRSPRPSIRRIGRQPGTVACLAAVAGAAWAGVVLAETLGIVAALHGRQFGEGWLFHFVVDQVFPTVGLAVAAA